MTIPESSYAQLFEERDYISADYMLRVRCAKDAFLRRLYKTLKQYDDSDRFFYVIATICADEKYAVKYIRHINEHRLTDEQHDIYTHALRLHKENMLDPNRLWVLLWLHKLDADKLVQAFDIDINRGRRRCLDIIKKYFM